MILSPPLLFIYWSKHYTHAQHTEHFITIAFGEKVWKRVSEWVRADNAKNRTEIEMFNITNSDLFHSFCSIFFSNLSFGAMWYFKNKWMWLDRSDKIQWFFGILFQPRVFVHFALRSRTLYFVGKENSLL